MKFVSDNRDNGPVMLRAVEIPILMYHFVRPSKKRLSERHNILELDSFLSQLTFLKNKFFFIDSREVLVSDNGSFKRRRPVWLTFDDGYKDCINYVLPALLTLEARGTFYIPTEAIFERKLLDVNKIHILLSSSKTPKQIMNVCSEVFKELKLAEVVGQSFDDLFMKYGKANLWNDAETEFLKKLLQRILPVQIRNQLLDQVFSTIVTRTESSWVDEFYLSPDDVRTLVDCGMEVGSHGHSHLWLEDLSESQQLIDVEKSFRLLESNSASSESRTLCYPFGSYDETTLKILSDLDVKTAVINDGNRIAKVATSGVRQLELDRIDVMFFDEFIRGAFAGLR